MNENQKLKRSKGELAKPQSDSVLALLNRLAAAFRQEISEETQAVYLQGLYDLPLSRLDEAVKRAIRECRFFPTVAELRLFEQEVEVPQDRLQAAYERRKQQVLEAPPVKVLASVLDEGEARNG